MCKHEKVLERIDLDCLTTSKLHLLFLVLPFVCLFFLLNYDFIHHFKCVFHAKEFQFIYTNPIFLDDVKEDALPILLATRNESDDYCQETCNTSTHTKQVATAAL